MIPQHADNFMGKVKLAPKVFEAWERGNRKLYKMVSKRLTNVSASEKVASSSRKRGRAFIECSLGNVSLSQLAFAKATLAEKRDVVDVIPPSVVETYFERRRASHIIASFVNSWVVSHRTKKGNMRNTELLVGPKQAIWEPRNLGFRLLYVLSRKNTLTLSSRSALHEVGHCLYCLWLVNPFILSLISAVFIVGDLGLLFLKRRSRRILLYIASILSYKRMQKHSK